MKLTNLSDRTQCTSDDVSRDGRMDFIHSDLSDITQLEEDILFVLHPMWVEKGDLL